MKNESAVQTQTRLALARLGGLCYRNNVGACIDDNGRMIRYGLANESAQLNKVIKSSDLIGCIPITIQSHHLGQTLGVFTAIECKTPGWHLTPGDQRGHAQQKFIDLVRSVGGFAGFVTDPSDIYPIIGRVKP